MSRHILTENETPWSENELAERLQRGEIKLELPPAQLRLISSMPRQQQGSPDGLPVDGVIEAIWQEHASCFVFEYKASSTPRVLENAMLQVQRYAHQADLLPLVIVPYLSEKSLHLLEVEKVSGVDLSGNGILIAPGMAIWRSGQPNRFKDSQPIRNVFRGNSSILVRCFLFKTEFASLVELRGFALNRLPDKADTGSKSLLTKGTVSKVIGALKEEKIILHGRESVRLTAPKQLMERLKDNYMKPRGRRLEGKMPCTITEAWSRLAASSLRYVATGDGSAGRYRLLSSVEKLSLYVDNLDAAGRLLEVMPGRVFPNIEIIEEKSDVVYFDARIEGTQRWASPIQAWLELALSGPREREAAQTLEDILLKGEADTLL